MTGSSSGYEHGRRIRTLVVTVALAGAGTAPVSPNRLWGNGFVFEPPPTGSEAGWRAPTLAGARNHEDAQPTRRAIAELRLLSGLTWDEIGQLFGVSRRTVHFWASGKAPSAGNERRLRLVLDIVRHADRGTSRSNRAALIDAKEGVTPFALLASQRFEEARAALGSGPGRRTVVLRELDPAAWRARMPLPPAELLEAEPAPIHRSTGRARGARTLRSKRRRGD